MEPKYLLIVKVTKGLVIRDTPRPESQGGRAMRSVAVGTALYAYDIHNIHGVEYARLVPQNPQRPEWVRVAEADHSMEYVDVYPFEQDTSDVSALVSAIGLLIAEIRLLVAGCEQNDQEIARLFRSHFEDLLFWRAFWRS
jgi:hypothetical protein